MNNLDLRTLDGRRLTLLLMGATEKGEDDWAVFSGIARLEDGTLYMDRGEKPKFEVRSEWIEQIRPVDPLMRGALLEADYFLPLPVGMLPAGLDGNDFLQNRPQVA